MSGVFSGWIAKLGDGSAAVCYLAWLLGSLGADVRDRDGAGLSTADLALRVAHGGLPPAPWTLALRSPSDAAYAVRFTGIDRTGWETCSDAAAWGWGGLASITGEPDGPPLAPGAPVAAMCAALHGLLAVTAARFARLARLEVEIPLADVIASLIEVAGLRYAADGSVRGRGGDWWGLAGWGVYPCADGKVALALRDPDQLARIGAFLGVPELSDARFADYKWGLHGDVDELNGLLVGGLLGNARDELVRQLAGERIAVAPVRSFNELLTCSHLLGREALREQGGLVLPALPIRGLGEPQAAADPYAGEAAPTTRPLAGARVLDISSVWAGPMAARLLADLGAEVTKVENPARRTGSFSTGAAWHRDFYAILNNRNKRAYQCDFSTPEGRAALEPLLREADVLIENFVPGSLARLGLGHETLHRINPHLVVVAMPALGLDGPHAHTVGYGTTIEQWAGLGWLYTDAAGEPHRSGINFSDPIAALYAATGAILALCGDRQRRVVEVSQQEAALSLMLPALAEYQRSGTMPRAVPAEPDGDGWAFPRLPDTRADCVPVRDVTQVVGNAHAPGSRAIRWVRHPDGRDYPLVVLPWKGAFSAAIEPVPAAMPQPLG